MIHLFKSKAALQKEWKEKTIAYAQSVNAFVDKGLAEGWDNAGPEPQDNHREKLVQYLLKAIRAANQSGDYAGLREKWPLAHSPLIPLLDDKAQSIPVVCILDDGSIVARIGTSYQEGHVLQINGAEVNVVPGIEHFGRSPNRKYFAYTTDKGVKVTEGWLGNEIAFCPYPTGIEGLPEDYKVAAFASPPAPTQLIPFPDGKRVLFVSPEGVFVLSEKKADRLLPSTESMREHFDWLIAEYPGDDLVMDLSMEHGAVSADGKWIAVGSQDTQHLIFNSDLELVGDIGNLSEYPHYAIFNNDSSMVALNSCHFYNGITLGVPTDLLPGLETEAYEEDKRIPTLEGGARVYAGVSLGNDFIVGDASGYLRAFSKDGERRWQHFIGSSVGDIDISPDGKTLVCSTYAGFISVLDLTRGKSEDYEIGDSGHTETRRWLIWKNEERALAW